MLRIKQISLKEANTYVHLNHRHHDVVQGHKFSIGCYDDDDRLVGVAIVGHPQEIKSNDGNTLEVLRLCTDGTYNACSMLYGRCSRIAKEFGYDNIITYILVSENGTSLKASGWKCENDYCGGNGKWTGNRQKERDKYQQLTVFIEPPKETPKEHKQLYVKLLN